MISERMTDWHVYIVHPTAHGFLVYAWRSLLEMCRMPNAGALIAAVTSKDAARAILPEDTACAAESLSIPTTQVVGSLWTR